MMTTQDVIVNKIIYHNQTTGYAVFSGTVLKWSPRKKVFSPTREVHTYVGCFFCLFQGDKFNLDAEEIFNPTYGSQCVVSRSKRSEPVTICEIRTFLTKNIKGMTPKRAERVIDQYGADAIHALRKDPHAYDFLGLDPAILEPLRTSLLENAAFEDLIVFLQVNNIDIRFALALHQQYGTMAVSIVADDPYAPFADHIFDFKTADRLYHMLGKDLVSQKRCAYCTLAALQMDSATKGNVFTRRRGLADKIRKLLDAARKGLPPGHDNEGFPFTEQQIDSAAVMLENAGMLAICKDAGEDRLYLYENYKNERTVADCLYGLMTQPKRNSYHPADIDAFLVRYESATGFVLAPEQRKAVLTAMLSPVSIIAGGPGTGKTQVLTVIIAAISALTPDAVIRACAPTGKAAIRVSNLTGIPAATIHRTLGLGQYGGRLKDGELGCDFVFVDEFSMADIDMCAKLFSAVSPSGRVVITGDYNQLPSVGPGLVLRDFIASNAIPKTVLTRIFRQKGGSRIIDNAHRIMCAAPGQLIKLRISSDPGEDFYFIPERDPEKILALVQRSILQAKRKYRYGLDSVQVLSPIHYGPLGTDHLNYVLQKDLNPNPVSIEFEDKEIRLGDKVAHIKNDYTLNVFNGEVGTVTDIAYTKGRAVKVSYPDREVWYPFIDLSELELAYAQTVHKLQGSEYPVIIMPVHELQGKGLSKNVIYTALTRAKKMVILIGSASALSTGLRRETTIERESNLVEMVQSKLPPAVPF